MFASMQDPLPWASCGHEWNNVTCRVNVVRCPENATLPPPTTMMATPIGNITGNVTCIPVNSTVTSPSEEYWK